MLLGSISTERKFFIVINLKSTLSVLRVDRDSLYSVFHLERMGIHLDNNFPGFHRQYFFFTILKADLDIKFSAGSILQNVGNMLLWT